MYSLQFIAAELLINASKDSKFVFIMLTIYILSVREADNRDFSYFSYVLISVVIRYTAALSVQLLLCCNDAKGAISFWTLQ